MISYISDVENAVQEISLTISSSSWSSTSPFTYSWTDSRIKTGSSIDVDFLDTSSDTSAAYITYEKISGGILFTASNQPSADIQISIRIVNAQADAGNTINADTVSTDSISGATNVDEALTVLETNLNAFVNNLLGNGLSRNGFYRGKNFGTLTSSNIDTFCTVHKIATGQFDDLFLGDYFVIQDGTYNIEWMIAGFDLDYGFKFDDNAKINYHSIAIIPKSAGLLQKRFNSTDSTATGVLNSELCLYLENTIKPLFANVLGTHQKAGRLHASNAADSSGNATGITIGTACVIIPSEVEFFGCPAYDVTPKVDQNGKKLLPVFKFISVECFQQDDFWIGGIANGTQFLATRHNGGSPFRENASYAGNYVRPLMFIG